MSESEMTRMSLTEEGQKAVLMIAVAIRDAVSDATAPLKAEIKVADQLLANWNRFGAALVELLGSCPVHGDNCKPNLIEMVKQLKGQECNPCPMSYPVTRPT